MRMKLFFSIVLIFSSVVLYAQDATPLGKSMIDNLNISNAKCITLAGNHDVVRIYVEKKSIHQNKIKPVIINHNHIDTTFNAGNNFAVTHDDILVFARKNNKIYASSLGNHNNSMSIVYGNLKYKFEGNYIRVSGKHTDEHIMAEEAIYDYKDSSFTLYKHGKVIKKVITDAI